jgi:formamidopyrimidine-DNA glycosylase
MPELPEVETVRRGLQPVMEGARFRKVEARRGDLRWPLPKDFVARLEGQTVEGLGRRAKYLLADLSSGDVLLMHLGMSGSFRVAQERSMHDGNDLDESAPGGYYHDRSKDAAHDHVVFHMSSGARISFNDPRRFGSMKIVAREKLDQEPLLRALGPEPLGNAFDAAMLARACKGKKTSLKAAWRRRSRPNPERRTSARKGSSLPSEPCSRTRSRPAARRCAITARPPASLASSSTISVSMTARVRRA